MKSTAFLLLAAMAFSTVFAQDLLVKTQPQDGYGPLPASLTIIYDLASLGIPPRAKDSLKPVLSGIPEDLTYSLATSQILNYSQLLYYGYKNGLTARNDFDANNERVSGDPTELTDQNVNVFINVLIGLDQDSQAIFVLDQNGNADFSDDKRRTLQDFSNAENREELIEENLFPVTYQYWNGREIVDDKVLVHLSKSDIMRERFPLVAFYGLARHRTGIVHFNGKKWPILLSGGPTTLSYDYPSVALLDKKGEIIPNSSASPGEYLILPDEAGYLRFEDASNGGEFVKLVSVPDAVEQGGSQVGLNALPREGESLTGEHISLKDYQGQYLLLDFWGSWCGPCVEELPYQKKAFELFKDRGFSALGVAMDDSAALTNFLAENPVPWKQVFQNSKGEKEIIKAYSISGYPTTFLIDPKGKIIGKGIRENALIARLCKLLGTDETIAAKLMAGNQLFSLPGYTKAEKVILHLKQDEEVNEHVLYPIDGKWQCGMELKSGEYAYQFEVDGEKMADPDRPSDDEGWTSLSVK
ncbi:MAG: redoxin domain-containing protein [Bacteroidota bacterium]